MSRLLLPGVFSQSALVADDPHIYSPGTSGNQLDTPTITLTSATIFKLTFDLVLTGGGTWLMGGSAYWAHIRFKNSFTTLSMGSIDLTLDSALPLNERFTLSIERVSNMYVIVRVNGTAIHVKSFGNTSFAFESIFGHDSSASAGLAGKIYSCLITSGANTRLDFNATDIAIGSTTGTDADGKSLTIAQAGGDPMERR